MIYIEINNGQTSVHYMPFDPIHGIKNAEGHICTPEELRTTGWLVESLPIPDPNGKIATLQVNPETGEPYYVYTEPVPTEAQQIADLKEQVAALNIAMANIMGV